MATYAELFDLRQNSVILNKITSAVAVKAKSVIDGAGTAGQKAWAREAIKTPRETARDLIWFVLVANKGSSKTQIIAAGDTAVQNNTDTAIEDVISDL